MRLPLLLLALVLVSGCASSTKIHTPSGSVGYNIDCSGGARNWGMCYEKAGEICGEKGYKILNEKTDSGAIISANQNSAFGGTVNNRNLLIECN